MASPYAKLHPGLPFYIGKSLCIQITDDPKIVLTHRSTMVHLVGPTQTASYEKIHDASKNR